MERLERSKSTYILAIYLVLELLKNLEADHSLPVNPFSKRETVSPRTLVIYKISTFVTWLLVVISSVYYAFNAPHDDIYARRTIWGQNKHHHTAFALNSIIASVYW
jgi:hypothetical protein